MSRLRVSIPKKGEEVSVKLGMHSEVITTSFANRGTVSLVGEKGTVWAAATRGRGECAVMAVADLPNGTYSVIFNNREVSK